MDPSTLYRLAQEHLQQSEYLQARELGHRLLKLRFSGAYEILAKSFHAMGELKTAITVLESGVREAPNVWLLWLQLGNYRAETRDLLGAVEAYKKARECPGAELDQILFNEAFLRESFGNLEKALELFAEVYQTTKDKRLRLVSLTHRLIILIDLDQITESLMLLGEAYLHEADNAELLSTLAFKLLEKGDRANALNLAKQSLGLRRAGKVARVVRLIEGERAEEVGLYRVTFKVSLENEDDVITPFLKTSQIFAHSKEEAVQFAVNFEPADIRPDLQVQEIVFLHSAKNEPKGVDWSSELIFFSPDEET